ncbi:MAG: putative PepSY TM-like [Humisphaera sp.]|nr:putative PepSY TM-like [Humisphaera sp.]
MYNVIRRVHLYAGLVVLVFLIMYFVSGYVMIHRPWFGGQSGKPAAETRTESLAGYSGARTPDALAAHVVARFQLHGRANVPPPARQPKDAVRFNVVRPGTIQQVEIPHAGDTVTITTQRENVAGIFVQLHRIHGYGGGWIWNAFVFFNDLASFACILFALTGVYLWWKTAKRKIWGVLCLGASCLYAAGMVLYLLNAR